MLTEGGAQVGEQLQRQQQFETNFSERIVESTQALYTVLFAFMYNSLSVCSIFVNIFIFASKTQIFFF